MLEKFTEEIKKYKNNEALHDAVGILMDDCKNNAMWLCERKHDEDGKLLEDEDGNYIYIEPEKDSYQYQLIEAYLTLARVLAKTVQ